MSQATTALVPAGAAPPAEQPPAPLPTFSREQIDIIKATVMHGASDMELKFFLELCKHKRLDPFSGQIVATRRRSWSRELNDWQHTWTYQTTIDGMRAIAEDSGEFEGCDPAEWCGPEGEWVQVWLKKEPPVAARVIAYRRGRRPAVGIANLDFFCQTFKDKSGTWRPTEIWSKGAAHMLAKCAEALALRKAFPRQLGAVYSREEMSGAGVIDVEATYESPPIPTTAELVHQDPAPADEEPASPAPSASHRTAPPPGPPASAGPTPPPAAAAQAPARSSGAVTSSAAGGGSPSERARALGSRILACKTEADVVALSTEVSEVVKLLGESPVAGDLQRIYSDHRKTVRRAAAPPPRGPEPAKAKSAPAARRDDEPPPPTDEDR